MEERKKNEIDDNEERSQRNADVSFDRTTEEQEPSSTSAPPTETPQATSAGKYTEADGNEDAGTEHHPQQQQQQQQRIFAIVEGEEEDEEEEEEEEEDAKETTGLTKLSRSLSVPMPDSPPTTSSRSSLPRRGTVAAMTTTTTVAAHFQDIRDSRRELLGRRNTSYGSIYLPLYEKLSLYQRLSFGDVVERITLTWEDISVYAPSAKRRMFWNRDSKDAQLQPKHILKNVSGAVEPGSLLAVMGASGSGKTTLLNVLTYRNRGSLMVQGEIRINGGSIGKGMASISAYVQQEDVFIGTLTVSEHLWFQSQLKMDSDIPQEIRSERVDDVIQEMGLAKCAGVLIGVPGKLKGISGGEKKRLAFASELLTNPPLMFLDEPTSGLDSYMAKNILGTLKSMTKRGRTVICTIHQPSSEVFELFDRLMLMTEGQVSYLGPAPEAGSFFKSCGFPIPRNYNPADHFVRTLAVEPGNEENCRNKIKSICERYSQSPQADYIQKVITNARLSEDGVMYEEESFAHSSPYKAGWWKQLVVLLWRSGTNNIREPTVFKVRFVQIVTLAIIFGLVYWHQAIDQTGVSNINGSFYLMQMQMTVGFVFNVVMLFPPEFPVFLREHFDGMYRVDTYFLSKTIVEFPQFVILPFLFTLIMYLFVGLYSSVDAFLICFSVNLLVCNISVSFGYLLSTAFSNVGLALAVGPLFIAPCMMIGGYFVNTASIPIYFIWLKYLSWFTYANEIMIVNQWQRITNITCADAGDDHIRTTIKPMSDVTTSPASPSEVRCLSTGTDIIEMLGYSPSNIPLDFVMLLILLIGFRVIAFILLALRARKSYKLEKK